MERAEEFTAFARARQGHLRRVAFLLCGDWHDAQDLTQTALLNLCRFWNRAGSQTHPAPKLFGALVQDRTDQSIFYSVQNHDYGRFILSVAPAKDAPPAASVQTWSRLLTDPRFNGHLFDYELYVLSHANAESFVVSGSKPLV